VAIGSPGLKDVKMTSMIVTVRNVRISGI